MATARSNRSVDQPIPAQTGIHDPDALQQATAWLDERFGLDTLWLFGSAATGTATENSDVDLAALFRRHPSAVELLEAREELSSLLGREVDLVNLEQVSPVLTMQVLRNGRLLLDHDPPRRIRLVAAAPGRYEDLSLVRRAGERALIERVRGGRS